MSLETAAFQRERNSTLRGPPSPLRAPSAAPPCRLCTPARPSRAARWPALEAPVLRRSPGEPELGRPGVHTPTGMFPRFFPEAMGLPVSQNPAVSCALRGRDLRVPTLRGHVRGAPLPCAPSELPSGHPGSTGVLLTFPPYPLQQCGLCASKSPPGLTLMPRFRVTSWVGARETQGKV